MTTADEFWKVRNILSRFPCYSDGYRVVRVTADANISKSAIFFPYFIWLDNRDEVGVYSPLLFRDDMHRHLTTHYFAGDNEAEIIITSAYRHAGSASYADHNIIWEYLDTIFNIGQRYD